DCPPLDPIRSAIQDIEEVILKRLNRACACSGTGGKCRRRLSGEDACLNKSFPRERPLVDPQGCCDVRVAPVALAGLVPPLESQKIQCLPCQIVIPLA